MKIGGKYTSPRATAPTEHVILLCCWAPELKKSSLMALIQRFICHFQSKTKKTTVVKRNEMKGLN